MTSPRTGQFQTRPAAYITVHIAMRNRLHATRTAKLFSQAGSVASWQVFTDVDEAVRRLDPWALTVLVVALDDIDPRASAAIAGAASAGVRTLVLIDEPDMRKLVQLNGLPGIGLAFEGSADHATLEAALVKLADTGLPRPVPPAVPSPRAAGPRLVSRDDAVGYLRLTPRERMVLAHLVDGLSNRQIARILDISENAVERLVANLLIKMNCSNRTEVVARTLRSNLYEELRSDPLTQGLG